MNGRFQMQGGKNWFLPKEMNANRFFWDSHWLEIWSNHFYPSMGPNGGSVAMDSDSNILYSTLLPAFLFGCVVYASATILVLSQSYLCDSESFPPPALPLPSPPYTVQNVGRYIDSLQFKWNTVLISMAPQIHIQCEDSVGRETHRLLAHLSQKYSFFCQYFCAFLTIF
jgi:hypothetical protein